MSYFQDWPRVVGFGVFAVSMFTALVLCVISFFNIRDFSQIAIVSKAISLLFLAAFGQSEALKFHLSFHDSESVGKWIRLMNGIGIVITILSVLALVFQIVLARLSVGNEIDEGTGRFWILFIIMNHSEILAFFPILFFIFVDVLLWAVVEKAAEAGKICFILTHVPILVPMAVLFSVLILFGQYASGDYHLLISGATVMYILVSIMLNSCARSLLKSIKCTSL